MGQFNKFKIASSLLFCLVLVLAAIVAYETWKIADLRSNPSFDDHPNTGSTTMSPTTTTAASTGTTTTPRPPPSPEKMAYLKTNLAETSVLHIWLKASGKTQEARLYVRKIGNSNGQQQNEQPSRLLASTTQTDWFNFWEFALEHIGAVEFSWAPSETVISYIYSFEPEKVSEEGICPVYISSAAQRPNRTGSFHFRPPLGWNNDPNGFSRMADGTYHLFYQHYPHAMKWDAMHWGHASSADMVNWIHQPIFLRPELDDAHRVGHIYSGTGYPLADGSLMLFYTDHMEGRPIVEFQRSVITKDFIRPIGPSRTIIREQPPQMAGQLAWDFRDPTIFVGPPPENALFMTLGSGWQNRSAGGLVLLYKQQRNVGKAEAAALEHWEYRGILHEDSRWGMDVCECSGLVPLQNPAKEDTLYALTYGAQNSRDPDGRVSLSPIIVGQFNGDKFVPMFEQILDFAVDSYAYQPFYDSFGDEPLLIGWLANHPPAPSADAPKPSFDAMITLPRVLKLSIDRKYLMTVPHGNLQSLRDKLLNVSAAGLIQGQPMDVPNPGAAEVQFFMNAEYDSELQLQMDHSEMGEAAIVLKLNGEGMEIVAKWDKPNTLIRRIARGARPTSVRIFIDLDAIEVFGDNGRWAATLRIPSKGGRIESVKFNGQLTQLKEAQMWTLKGSQFLRC